MWPKYNKPFYFHFREDDRYLNGITVCMKPVSEGKQVFKVGVACCTPQDNFSKKIGRSIAAGRAEKTCETIEASDFDELLNKAQLISSVAENNIQNRHGE